MQQITEQYLYYGMSNFGTNIYLYYGMSNFGTNILPRNPTGSSLTPTCQGRCQQQNSIVRNKLLIPQAVQESMTLDCLWDFQVTVCSEIIIVQMSGNLLHAQVSDCKYPGMKLENQDTVTCSTLAQDLVYSIAAIEQIEHTMQYRIDNSGS